MARQYAMGWRRDKLDHRDSLFAYCPPENIVRNIPRQTRLPNFPIWDQGNLGSCTGNGIAFGILYDAVKQGLMAPTDVPSRLMIYWMERFAEGTVSYDSGAEIRDGIKAVAAYGTCKESGPDSWPYNISQFAVKPPPACWTAALQFQALRYQPLQQGPQQLRACLAEGFPFIFGFVVYQNMMTDYVEQTGILGMPDLNVAPLGGHCVVTVGHDDDRRVYICRNSWSDQWGDHGYFTMPYEYMHDPYLASSFWTIRVVG